MEKSNLIVKIGLVFYISSIIGYFYELILNYIYEGKIFSHGILNGPWLPIYGTGAIFIMLLQKYQDKPLIIFFLSFLITGILEGISGFLLLKVLKMRLWDYTGHFLNIGGFVCLLSAFCFGVGGLLVIYVLLPLIEKLIQKFNKKYLKIILTSISLIFGIDIIATIVK